MYTLICLNNHGSAFLYSPLTYALYRHHLQTLSPHGNIVAIAASIDNKPTGLALVKILEDRTAELLSLFVKPADRCQGIGTALLTSLEQELSLRGCTEIEIVYTTGHKTTEVLEHLLLKFNWTKPKPRKLVCKTTIYDIANAPWMKISRLPRAYEIFPWSEITPHERLTLEQEQEQKPWIAADADPLEHEKNLEPLNSLGLRYQGRVVGWTISHRLNLDTIRYTCGYLSPELQKMGRFIPLLVNAIQLQTAAKIPRGIWTTALVHNSFVGFINKHMKPYLVSLEQSKGSNKLLSSRSDKSTLEIK